MKYLLAAALLLLAAGCAGDGSGPGSNMPEAARINTQLGLDYMRRGQMEQALDKLKRAVSQDPSYAVAHSSIAYVYQKRGEAALAEEHYRRALALDRNNAVARNNFGVFLCSQTRFKEADEKFMEAARDPSYPTPEAAYTNAGTCAKGYNPQKAENYFREALRINPEYGDALANLAWIAFQSKDYLRTRAFLQRYELVGKPTAETLLIATLTERELGDDLAARKYEIRLRREFPGSNEVNSLDRKAANE